MKLYKVTYFDHLDWRHVTYLVVADSPATVEQNVLDRELRGRPYRREEDSLSVDELEDVGNFAAFENHSYVGKTLTP